MYYIYPLTIMRNTLKSSIILHSFLVSSFFVIGKASYSELKKTIETNSFIDSRTYRCTKRKELKEIIEILLIQK